MHRRNWGFIGELPAIRGHATLLDSTPAAAGQVFDIRDFNRIVTMYNED